MECRDATGVKAKERLGNPEVERGFQQECDHVERDRKEEVPQGRDQVNVTKPILSKSSHGFSPPFTEEGRGEDEEEPDKGHASGPEGHEADGEDTFGAAWDEAEYKVKVKTDEGWP